MDKNELMVWIGITMIAITMFTLGWHIGSERNRKSAIRAGVGEYVIIDKENAQGHFQWKTNTANLK